MFIVLQYFNISCLSMASGQQKCIFFGVPSFHRARQIREGTKKQKHVIFLAILSFFESQEGPSPTKKYYFCCSKWPSGRTSRPSKMQKMLYFLHHSEIFVRNSVGVRPKSIDFAVPNGHQADIGGWQKSTKWRMFCIVFWLVILYITVFHIKIITILTLRSIAHFFIFNNA